MVTDFLILQIQIPAYYTITILYTVMQIYVKIIRIVFSLRLWVVVSFQRAHQAPPHETWIHEILVSYKIIDSFLAILVEINLVSNILDDKSWHVSFWPYFPTIQYLFNPFRRKFYGILVLPPIFVLKVGVYVLQVFLPSLIWNIQLTPNNFGARQFPDPLIMNILI